MERDNSLWEYGYLYFRSDIATRQEICVVQRIYNTLVMVGEQFSSTCDDMW